MRPNVPEEVLAQRVDRSRGPDACWPWTGLIGKRGYGRVIVRCKEWRAHRLAWVIWMGPIPAETPCVLHRCDNPPCCNPAHLWLGTDLDNQRDMWAKGRAVRKAARGEASGATRLTDELVLAIRRRYDEGTSSYELAQAYGVGSSTIAAIISGQSWSHLPIGNGPREPGGRKLTAEQVRAIRAEPSYWGINAALSREYGVHAVTIADLRAGKTYRRQ